MQRKLLSGTVYITANHRGVEYSVRKIKWGGWEVKTRRLKLGRANVGGVKQYPTIDDLQKSCKAFAPIKILEAF